ncbi:MAG TPA: type II secretion system protein GspJ, partial [Oscillospiraceae bacterium]|nr:type II secretion system protein GspJ [Oscillospiraceae bacterium]
VSRPAKTEDVALFFKNISYDLRNSFKMEDIRFHGGRDRISFPTRIKRSVEGKVRDSIGRVTYSLDRRKKSLYKHQANYSEIYRKKPGSKKMLADQVSSLRFEYFIYNAQYKKYSWVTSWQEREEPFGVQPEYRLPLIVRIEVGMPDGNSEKKFVKTVYVPSACCWPFEDEEKQ